LAISIHEIDTRIVEHPLKQSRIILSPVGTHDRSRFLIVTMYDPDGVRGYGEAATTPQWSGETAETAQWVIENLFAPRLVGNGAYRTADEAVPAIEKLLPYRLALVEQPTHRDRIRQLAEVRRRIKVPVMADEAVFTPDQLTEALDCDAFDVLAVYPGKNGGVTTCMEMAQTAQRAGKKCAIGSNLESDLGQAAMAAIAAGLKAFPVEEIPCDFQAALFYHQSSIKQPMKLKNGRAAVPFGSGFGVEPVG